METKRQKTASRRAEIYKLRTDGLTFSEIGSQFKITAGRARAIFEVAQQIIEDEPNPFHSLRCATRNILCNKGIETLESLSEFYQKWDKGRSKWPRGYGWKTHLEIASLLGLPKPQKFSMTRICPHCGKPV